MVLCVGSIHRADTLFFFSFSMSFDKTISLVMNRTVTIPEALLLLDNYIIVIKAQTRIIAIILTPPVPPFSLSVRFDTFALEAQNIYAPDDLYNIALEYFNTRQEIKHGLVLERCEDLIKRCTGPDRIILSIVYLNLK